MSETAAARPKRRSWVRYVPNAVRLCLFLLATLIIATAVTAQKVSNDLEASLIEVGREMMRMPRETMKGVREFTFNGASVFVYGRTVRGGKEKVLNLFERRCRDANRGVNADIERAFERLGDRSLGQSIDPPAGWDRLMRGTLRHEGGDEGMVSCLQTPDRRSGVESFLSRVERFSQSGDLSDVGYLRYVYTVEEPKLGTTFVLGIWSDSPLKLHELFPQDGSDVPGREIPNVKRPAKSQRLVAMRQRGAPYAVNVYRAHGSLAKLMAYYQNDLLQQGFRIANDSANAKGSKNGERRDDMIIASKGARVLSLIMQQDDENQRTPLFL